MDLNANADKVRECTGRLSFNQASDIDNTAAFGADLFTVAEFKLYAKIDDFTEDDVLIGLMIGAAQKMCENYVGMNFRARTVTAIINNLNGGTYLPYGPIGAIASVEDIDGNTVVSGNYKIVGSQFKQVLWPTVDYLKVTYTGGYVTCPADLINAVKAQTLFLYENRGDSSTGMSPVATLILNPLKRL